MLLAQQHKAAMGATNKGFEDVLKLKQQLLQGYCHIDPAFVPDELLRTVWSTHGVEMMPACAVLSGLLAQEVLKLLSGRDAPFHNWLVLDALECEAKAMRVGV